MGTVLDNELLAMIRVISKGPSSHTPEKVCRISLRAGG